MENKRKHLEFIQKTIARMAQNSFFLRGWVVALVVLLLGLFVTGTFIAGSGYLSYNYFPFVCLPVIIFWILDGYFLSQERLFRALYDHVRELDEQEIDFSMDISEHKEDKKNGWLSSMFSLTLLSFYLPFMLFTAFLFEW